MSEQVSDLTSAQEEALEVLWNNGGQIVKAEKVAEARNTSEKAARRLLKRMSPELVSVESDPQGNIYSFTDTGRTLAEEMFQASPYGGGNVPADVSASGEEDRKRLHAFTVQARIQNSRFIPDDWMCVLQEREKINFLKAENNDYIAARDTWVIRFHKDSITFQLRDGCSIYGRSSSEVLRKAHSQAQDVGSWVEKVADVDLQLERFLISRSELAFEEHPLAELADDLPGVPLSRFEVVDRDIGKTVLEMDASPGLPELEAKSGEQCERVAQSIEREMEEYANHPEAVEFRHSFEREASVQNISGQEAVHSIRKVNNVEKQMDKTVTTVSEVQEEVSDIKQKQKQLLELKKEERDTRDAIIELVRSNQNVIQELKEQVQDSDGRQGYDDPVQEIFMEIWDDPEYNRPFFRDAADGGEHLMAFRSDGSGCETILDADTVSRLR